MRGLCNIPVFREFESHIKNSPEIQKIIISEVKLEIVKAGQALFDFGEYGDKYYIILKGEVDLYKPKVNVQAVKLTHEEEQQLHHKETYNPQQVTGQTEKARSP